MPYCKHLKREKKKDVSSKYAVPLIVILHFYLTLLLLRPNLKELRGDYPFISRTGPPVLPQRHVPCPEKTITEWSDISPFIWFLQSYTHAPY